jgi:hypothetical protein
MQEALKRNAAFDPDEFFGINISDPEVKKSAITARYKDFEPPTIDGGITQAIERNMNYPALCGI